MEWVEEELVTVEQPAKQFQPSPEYVVYTHMLKVSYNNKVAISDITLGFRRNTITAIIGPSGCGKSTLLRCINRMNDLVPAAKVEGQVFFNGDDIYSSSVDPVFIRFRIGMVFQRPNPFPMSIFDNVAFGLRVNGIKLTKDELRDRVKDALVKAALWDEVRGRLHDHAYTLSGGQQQRLCIARSLAVEPEVLLLDEPTVSLDPVSTAKIEQLLRGIVDYHTIIIVTHNMQQAARVSDYTAVLMPDTSGVGRLIEHGPTGEIFTNPREKKTEDYIRGKVG